DAISNGAKFIVMPGFDKKTVLYCIKKGVPVIPGVMTPSEIMNASSYGLKVLKLFPAVVSGGTKLLQALKGPFNDIMFIPTGGITEENADEYLSLSNVIAVGGSWK
ncbi:MAG: 2-dehydro-3-deoxyphosphogluconate aldolase, partial [Treponema sp.]|nr:2-dehydro-3-deoxyphosphogluconate aldolase [Treponema sp.]